MNAKQELIKHIQDRVVKYVHIVRGSEYDDAHKVFAGKLPDVLPLLDFEYNDGYGAQELFGNIWYADGTWSERREYDGSEWWVHVVCPPIP
jgi:hypothetical protein